MIDSLMILYFYNSPQIHYLLSRILSFVQLIEGLQ